MWKFIKSISSVQFKIFSFTQLQFAYRSEFEYDLELKFDHNCNSLMSQWYFFKITNTKKKFVITFTSQRY